MKNHNTGTLQAPTSPNPLEVLKWTDAAVQSATHSIISLARAAKGFLALDAASLMIVADLLDQIDEKAHDIQNGVNYDAERCGVNYTDDERDKLSKKLHAQHHALNKPSGVTA